MAGRPRILPAILVLSCALFLSACLAAPRTYSTWASLGEKVPVTRPVEVEALPPAGARPWAGTVSHHLLAAREIDRWFAELASRRDVEVFYILSPSHWGLSTQDYSLTDGSWLLPGGRVDSDRARAKTLARRLGLPLEPRVFDPEHGVSTLIPFIARYFPSAKVVAVAYRGEPPLDQPMAERLALALAPAFEEEGRESNFLLISTDFSHHGDQARTEARDEVSRRFLSAPSRQDWILAGCDNRPGAYVLGRLLDGKARSAILFHCDSFALSGQAADDITSYFFTYFW